MKKTLLSIGVFAMTFAIYGQNTPTLIKKCATEEYMQYRESVQPGYIQATKDAFEVAKASQEGVVLKNNETLRIPVVVHVVYDETRPEMNLADSVIHNQIKILNDDFNRTNADTTNMRSDFNIVTGEGLNIVFELAAFDPQGNPTTGITRTSTTTSSFLDFTGMMDGGGIAEKVKYTAEGGSDAWDQSRYMNIWVCNMALAIFGLETPMVLGYATPPADMPNWPEEGVGNMSDGVVVQYQFFGSNNPTVGIEDYEVLGRTVTHEVGHYLGLRHIWGDAENCIEDDGIEDTPNATENSQESGCIHKNTCDNDDIYGVDLPDMWENYMDYSDESCQNSFTNKQIALMRGVLENQRADLVAEDNGALAIKEDTKLNVAMHPNPTNNFVTLVSDKNLKGAIKIVDLSGKIVAESFINGIQTTIDVSHLQSGIYQVFVEGKTGASKLVKF